jgi:hypothetical protein
MSEEEYDDVTEEEEYDDVTEEEEDDEESGEDESDDKDKLLKENEIKLEKIDRGYTVSEEEKLKCGWYEWIGIVNK